MCPPSLYHLAAARALKADNLNLDRLPRRIRRDIDSLKTLPEGWRFADDRFVLVVSEYNYERIEKLLARVSCPCIDTWLPVINKSICRFGDLLRAATFEYLLRKLYQINSSGPELECLYSLEECLFMQSTGAYPRHIQLESTEGCIDTKTPRFVIVDELAKPYCGRMHRSVKSRSSPMNLMPLHTFLKMFRSGLGSNYRQLEVVHAKSCLY